MSGKGEGKPSWPWPNPYVPFAWSGAPNANAAMLGIGGMPQVPCDQEMPSPGGAPKRVLQRNTTEEGKQYDAGAQLGGLGAKSLPRGDRAKLIRAMIPAVGLAPYSLEPPHLDAIIFLLTGQKPTLKLADIQGGCDPVKLRQAFRNEANARDNEPRSPSRADVEELVRFENWQALEDLATNQGFDVRDSLAKPKKGNNNTSSKGDEQMVAAIEALGQELANQNGEVDAKRDRYQNLGSGWDQGEAWEKERPRKEAWEKKGTNGDYGDGGWPLTDQGGWARLGPIENQTGQERWARSGKRPRGQT